MNKLSRVLVSLILVALLAGGVGATNILDSLTKQFQVQNSEGQSRIANQLSLLNMDINPKEALRLARQALTISKRDGYISEQARALNNMGLALSFTNDPGAANIEFDKAIKLAHQHNLLDVEAFSWLNLGIVYVNRNWSTEAKACFKEAKRLFSKTNSASIEYLYGMGQLSYYQKDYNGALDYLQRAYIQVKANGDEPTMVLVMKYLVNVYDRLGQKNEVNFYKNTIQSYFVKKATGPFNDNEMTSTRDVVAENDSGYEGNRAEQVVNYQTKNNKTVTKPTQLKGRDKLFLRIIYGLIAILAIMVFITVWLKKRYNDILGNHSVKIDQDNKKLQDTNFLLREEIKKRYDVEKKIIEEKAFLDSLLNSNPDLISYKDVKGNYIGCNKAFEDFYGMSTDELKGKTEVDLTDETRARVIQEIEQKINQTGKMWNDKVWVKNKDKTKALLHILKTPFYSPDKQVLGVITIARDITEIQKAEEEIVKLSHAVEQSPVSIVITDTAGKMEYVNPMFSEITGYTKEESLGQSMSILKSGMVAQEMYEDLWETITSGRNWSGELYNKKKNGDLFWEYTNISPIYDKNGTIKHYLATQEDISQRKENEKVVLNAKIMAENANRTKSEFLAKMSHEIRTPMHGIIGMADLLIESEKDKDKTEQIGIIKSSANNLMSILNDIFDYTRMENEDIELENVPFRVSDTIEEVVGFMNEKVSEKNIELNTYIDTEIPDILDGDQVRLRQIVLNLTNNAIKFTHQGEINLSANLIESKEDRVKISFRVKDTGVGISDVGKEKLFQSFSQIDDSNSREFGGTGLGLVIAKRLVEAMGGEIKLKSEVGKGSTFTFTAWLNRRSDKLGQELKNVSIAGLKALYVGKNEDFNTINEILKDKFITLKQKDSAQEAFVELNKQVGTSRMYDLVWVDFNLPDADGNIFAQTLQADKFLRDIKMILVTGKGFGLTDEVKNQMNLWGLLHKPFDEEKLLLYLSKIVTSRNRTKGGDAKSSIGKRHARSATRVLLVEDNLVNQKVAGLNLKKMGFDYHVADNGKIAYEKYVDEPYPVVLMDIQMPVMDGFEATQKIREFTGKRNLKDPVIIALTANAMRGDKEKYLAAGMNDFLSKPLDINEFRKVLEKHELLV